MKILHYDENSNLYFFNLFQNSFLKIIISFVSNKIFSKHISPLDTYSYRLPSKTNKIQIIPRDLISIELNRYWYLINSPPNFQAAIDKHTNKQVRAKKLPFRWTGNGSHAIVIHRGNVSRSKREVQNERRGKREGNFNAHDSAILISAQVPPTCSTHSIIKCTSEFLPGVCRSLIKLPRKRASAPQKFPSTRGWRASDWPRVTFPKRKLQVINFPVIFPFPLTRILSIKFPLQFWEERNRVRLLHGRIFRIIINV